MQETVIIAAILSSAITGVAIGFVFAMFSRVRSAELALIKKTTDISDILARASDANLSLGKKIQTFEDRLQVIEFTAAGKQFSTKKP